MFLLPNVPSILRKMASFVRITPGKVYGGHRQRYYYAASWRAGTIHYCITVSFDVLPSQRVSFDVLPTQRVYPWYSISDGFVLPRNNQFLTDTRYVSMCDQYRFIILERSSPTDTMDHERDEAKQQSTSNFNERFTMAWAKLKNSFFLFIAKEAMSLIS